MRGGRGAHARPRLPARVDRKRGRLGDRRDPLRPVDPAVLGELHPEDRGGPPPHQLERGRRRVQALVGHDRDPGELDEPGHPVEVVEAERLLDELELERGEVAEERQRLIEAEHAVGVDPEAHLRPDGVPDGGDVFDVLRRVRRTDLHLDQAEAAAERPARLIGHPAAVLDPDRPDDGDPVAVEATQELVEGDPIRLCVQVVERVDHGRLGVRASRDRRLHVAHDTLDLERTPTDEDGREALADQRDDRGLRLGAALEAVERLRLAEAGEPARPEAHDHVVLVLEHPRGELERDPVREPDRDYLHAIDRHCVTRSLGPPGRRLPIIRAPVRLRRGGSPRRRRRRGSP